MSVITISIVSGSSQANLEQSLSSIKGAIPDGVTARLVVTDNGAQWNLARSTAAVFPDAKIVKNSEPKGFGANHNQALIGQQDDFALIANDDITVDPEAISQLLAVAEQHPRGAIFGPLLYPGSWNAAPIAAGGRLGESIPKPILNAVSLNLRFFLGDGFIRRFLGKRQMKHEPCDETKAYISGAFCLVRRSYIEQHGLFDADFYMYFDDIDLGTQIRSHGFECWQAASAKVMHLEGGSFSPRTWNWIMQSNLRYCRKYHGPCTRLIVHVFLCFLRICLKLKGVK